MKSESAYVRELTIGQIGKFLIFKMTAHFHAKNVCNFSNGIVMFLLFSLISLFLCIQP